MFRPPPDEEAFGSRLQHALHKTVRLRTLLRESRAQTVVRKGRRRDSPAPPSYRRLHEPHEPQPPPSEARHGSPPQAATRGRPQGGGIRFLILGPGARRQNALALSRSPSRSSSPKSRFMFCTACPEAPLSRLSIAETICSLRPYLATCTTALLVLKAASA